MQRSERIRAIVAVIMNAAVFGIMVYCFVSLIQSLINGSNKFIYFTYISNLLVGLMALVNVPFLIGSIAKNKYCVPLAFSLLKFVLISMTTLTFFVVLFVIGPIEGYPKSYSGRSFFTHLVVPLLSLVSYLFFEEKSKLKWKHSLIALIPFAAYSVAYAINVVLLESWPDIYQINKQGLWYLFLIVFLIADFGLGQGLYFLKKFIDSKTTQNG